MTVALTDCPTTRVSNKYWVSFFSSSGLRQAALLCCPSCPSQLQLSRSRLQKDLSRKILSDTPTGDTPLQNLFRETPIP